MKRKNKIGHIITLCLIIVEIAFPQTGTFSGFKIHAIQFNGNQKFTNHQLKQLMLSRPSSILKSSKYTPQLLKEDLNNLKKWYHQNGYLEAEITHHNVIRDSRKKRVRIKIELVEGKQTELEGISLLGNDTFPDTVLIKQIFVHSGDPFIKKNMEKSTLDLLTFYANRGYIEAEINLEYQINSEIHRAWVDFIIQEGEKYKINQIRWFGLDKTKDRIISRELAFQSGEVVNYSRLLKSQRMLYLTGLFQSVYIQPVSTQNDDFSEKDIRIDLRENKSIELNASIGYGSLEKLRGRIELLNNNWLGRAYKYGFTIRASFINWGLEASFSAPWTLGTRWKTDVNLKTEYLEEPGYHLNRTEVSTVIGRTFKEKSTVNMTLRTGQASLSEVKVKEIPAGLKTNVRSLKLTYIYDTRNNLFNATRGLYFEWSNEFGGTVTNIIHGFWRSSGKIKVHLTLGSSTTFVSSLDLGWMEAKNGLSSIPLQERYYTGGPNSIRGFEYQRVGPLDNYGIPLGGQIKAVWNILEIRQNLYKMIGLAFFADAGNVWSDPKQFNMKNLRISPGIGVRLNTPIGIARLDLGINIDPLSGEPKIRWVFNMGQAF